MQPIVLGEDRSIWKLIYIKKRCSGFISKHENVQAILNMTAHVLGMYVHDGSCQLLAKEWALGTGKLPRRLAQEQCG